MADNQHCNSMLRLCKDFLRRFPFGRNDISGKENSPIPAMDDEKKQCVANGSEQPPQDVTLNPAVQLLQEHIESDGSLVRLFVQAFEEIPAEFQAIADEKEYPRIRDYTSMINVIDKVIKMPPPWASSSRSESVIGCPMNEAMIWLMNTRTGSEIFSREDINGHFAAILHEWANFLSSDASLSVINDKERGWLCKDALTELLHAVNSAHNTPFQASSFEEVFECQPSLPSYGFKSWDDFFTRRFRPNLRPIASPTDAGIVINPCESQPLCVVANALAECHFSLKGRSYSLLDMLDNDEYAYSFVGGTVYQGWLSLLNYHRWHAPISGTVVKILQIRGTYFAADPRHGFENIEASTGRPSPDRQAPDASQTLLTSIATRTVILLQADDKELGLVGFVAIGMSEVSSCIATVAPGQHVFKGEEMGSFHYGGSSYCLLFGPQIKLQFASLVNSALEQEAQINGRCIAVNSELARVSVRGSAH